MNRPPKITDALWLLLATLLAVILAGACQTQPDVNSGESHFGRTQAFLRVCEDGVCEDGDQCSCGVCTFGCTSQEQCVLRIYGEDNAPTNPPSNIECRLPLCGSASALQADTEADQNAETDQSAEKVCEVTCDESSDCAFLDERHTGPPHTCRGGFCRTAGEPEQPLDDEAPSTFCPEGRLLVPGEFAPEEIGYCLDETEVTVAQFSACVDADECDAPTAGNILTAGRDDHPVQFVDQIEAGNYCAFANGRLPSRAEWRVAAQGGTSADSYPWGDEVPEPSDVPQRVCAFDGTTTCPVDGFAAGTGAYGHVDLAGNVAELVVRGDESVCAAGGAFDSSTEDLNASSCANFTGPAVNVGFRCASDL